MCRVGTWIQSPGSESNTLTAKPHSTNNQALCHVNVAIQENRALIDAILIWAFTLLAREAAPLYCMHKTKVDLHAISNKEWNQVACWRDALTDFTIDGIPHSVLSNLWLCNFPLESICRSRTSTPTTLGFIGFGYFCIAAVVTVSQGWLSGEDKSTQKSLVCNHRDFQIMSKLTKPPKQICSL